MDECSAADPNFVYNSGCNTVYNQGSSVRTALYRFTVMSGTSRL